MFVRLFSKRISNAPRHSPCHSKLIFSPNTSGGRRATFSSKSQHEQDSSSSHSHPFYSNFDTYRTKKVVILGGAIAASVSLECIRWSKLPIGCSSAELTSIRKRKEYTRYGWIWGSHWGGNSRGRIRRETETRGNHLQIFDYWSRTCWILCTLRNTTKRSGCSGL
jgi:hypothetical protein